MERGIKMTGISIFKETIDDEIDLLLEDEFNTELDDEINKLLNEAEEDEATEQAEQTEGQQSSNTNENEESSEEDTNTETDDEESQEENPEATEQAETSPNEEAGAEGGQEENPENSDETEENIENSGESLVEDKERYSYFQLFTDMYENTKFFIDKMKDIIDSSSSKDEEMEDKTILRIVLDEIFSIKEDLEFLLIEKIGILSLENIQILYVTLSSKTKLLLELVDKIIKMESSKEHK